MHAESHKSPVRWHPRWRWAALVAISVPCVLLLHALRLPAALLLGPMAAGIVVASTGGELVVPEWSFQFSQAVIGCMISRVITPSILTVLSHHALVFLASTVGVIAVSNTLGWLLTRLRVLPGTTAVWGSSPGAATAMVLLADAHGADARLVALMQYLRVLLVAVVASVVARLATGGAASPATATDWTPAIAWLPFAQTLGIALLGLLLMRYLRVSAGALLLPLALGTALHGIGLVRIELPPWLLAASYALVGWNIGLRFTRPVLLHAARKVPWIIGSNLLLIASCGILAAVLTKVAGIDPLTAYLATSPGGADSIAIIAAAGKVDLPFVMALQTARFVLVLLTGSTLARFIARRTG